MYMIMSRIFFARNFAAFFVKGAGGIADKMCDWEMAHKYGAYEALRWDGLYIYYCPAGLTFIATCVSGKGKTGGKALISGPIVMGSPEDESFDYGERVRKHIALLPRRTPDEVTALSKVQGALAMFLTGIGQSKVQHITCAKAEIFHTLYEAAEQMKRESADYYPVQLREKMQELVSHGDREGITRLIEVMFERLYESSNRDLSLTKKRTKELVVLFFKASIVGEKRLNGKRAEQLEELSYIDKAASLQELIGCLTERFYDFAGSVLDMSRFEHADILFKAMRYIKEHYMEKITIDDVALYAGISRSYLSTVFKKERGETITEYINRIRVEKSRELLKNPSLSLAEIADMAGYNDQSYFTKVFTKATGVSPGKYRKKGGDTTARRSGNK